MPKEYLLQRISTNQALVQRWQIELRRSEFQSWKTLQAKECRSSQLSMYLNDAKQEENHNACEQDGTQEREIVTLFCCPICVRCERHHHCCCQDQCFQHNQSCKHHRSNELSVKFGSQTPKGNDWSIIQLILHVNIFSEGAALNCIMEGKWNMKGKVMRSSHTSHTTEIIRYSLLRT